MANVQSKRLSDIKNDFERGVFTVVYQSRKQKFSRFLALLFLIFKHILRGVFFSWPLYLLAMAVFVLPDVPVFIAGLFVIPGIYISWVILSRGVHDDYENLIDGYILRSGYLGRLLFHNKH